MEVPAYSTEKIAKPSGLFSENMYLNRELSWIEFNSRVLDEALDPTMPLLERLKFLSIFSSNLDEFFMVRVSGIQEQAEAATNVISPDGLTPETQLRVISERLRPLLELQMRCLSKQVLPGLESNGVRILSYNQLNNEQREEMRDYFNERIFPILTPLSFDMSHPFPYMSNISMNLGIFVVPEKSDDDDETKFARVKMPPNVPRLIPISHDRPYTFLLLEDLMSAHIHRLFPGMRVVECSPFRITRNADVEIEEEEAADLLKTVEEQLRRRKFGFYVRLEVTSRMSESMVKLLCDSMELNEQDVYKINGLLNIPGLTALNKLSLPELKDPPFKPTTPSILTSGDSMFDVISRQDILLHHPYDSFGPVVEFLRQAARDPNVLAIKQTLYRVGKDSPLIDALEEAAENGKQVAVLVELKARFDEENNIHWARRLEKAGVHVVYGLLGLKTHAKVMLVVRQEKDVLRRYVHLSTGNYNIATSRLYTDIGLFTSDPDFGADATDLFNFLTGYSKQVRYRKLMVAPVNLRKEITELIRREVTHFCEGRPAGITAQFNSFTDTEMIDELYAASREGVPINLMVRGICCLRPGIPEISQNIQVGSIVGRFLEHSRIYRFINGGKEEVFVGSADLMSRNLDRRVEILFPIEDEKQKDRIIRHILEAAMRDNVKMRRLQTDGSYSRARNTDEKTYNFQQELLEPALIA